MRYSTVAGSAATSLSRKEHGFLAPEVLIEGHGE